MLVLSRYKRDTVIINNGEIVVVVVDVRDDGKVRLGFEAPKHIRINRGEVQQQIEETGLNVTPDPAAILHQIGYHRTDKLFCSLNLERSQLDAINNAVTFSGKPLEEGIAEACREYVNNRTCKAGDDPQDRFQDENT